MKIMIEIEINDNCPSTKQTYTEHTTLVDVHQIYATTNYFQVILNFNSKLSLIDNQNIVLLPLNL